MKIGILVAGITLSLIWLLAVTMLEKKKRKIWLFTGGVIAVLMLLYTQQWKMFLWGIAAGIAGGCGLMGERLGRLRKFWEENGILHTIIIFVIFCVLVFMSMAVAAPGLVVE